MEEPKVVKKELSATVEQNGILSVGEGVMIVRHRFEYTVVGGQMSVFDIAVDNAYKVTNVEGTMTSP